MLLPSTAMAGIGIPNPNFTLEVVHRYAVIAIGPGRQAGRQADRQTNATKHISLFLHKYDLTEQLLQKLGNKLNWSMDQ